ncbi:MAG TPA: ABC transporter permease [Bacillota bacterium]|nr:ABC transporter permease [Bacillota bacterium]HQC35465.1 ABC transporter permease [Bacillota bacterium]
MRKSDMLHMCLQNLTRRKSRTVLTVLGVMIGCCAIVIMVSLGFGTQEAQSKMLAQMGDLTMIQVYSYNYNNGNENKLDTATVNNFRGINGVQAATPKLNIGNYYSAQLYAGTNRRYAAEWCAVVGIDMNSFDAMDYKLISGRKPEKEDEVVVGQHIAYNFRDTMRPQGHDFVNRWDCEWDEMGYPINMPDPFFDIMGAKLTMEVQLNNGTIKREYKVVGVLEEDYNKGYETSEGLVLDVGNLTSLLEQAFVKDSVSKKITYNEVYVKCVDIDHVADVQKEIESAGFSSWSMESIREPLQKEARQKQMMLGGLGAISLLVAAIGIANTMIMSISERTREIGIMKALGCYLGDIRFMFLTEAGLIGLIGGIAASLVSVIAMVTINLIAFKQGINMELIKTCFAGSEELSRTSVLPWWLIVFGIIFSIVIGLVSGYAPANKAVRISALEAIRSSE